MVNMTDIFGNALSIAGSFMDSDLVNRFMMVIFAVILVFGVLNCILGYRLLRFWMMLGGFLVGGGLALVVVHTMGTGEINNADRSAGGRSCVRSDCISDL